MLSRQAPTWRSAFILAVGALTWLALAPADRLPPIDLWDKLAHAIAYAVLAMLLHAGWPRMSWPGIWITLLGYGLLMETLQLLVPGRTFSGLDLVADALGIAAYAAAARGLPGRLPPGRAT